VEIKELDQAMEQIIEGRYAIEERTVMEAHSDKLAAPLFAFNDFVVVRKDAIRMIRVRVHVDHEFLQSYTADGLIISSPTGSTAYSLSSNGPILTPSLEAFVINPICPHMLTMRPLVISSHQVVQIQLEAPCHALFSADGVIESDIDHHDVVIIKEAKHRVHLVKLRHRSFFDILRSKLSWGEDVRNAGE
jgi:NAD+ kinase